MKYFDDEIVNEGTVSDLKDEFVYRKMMYDQSKAPKDVLGNPTSSVNPLNREYRDTGARHERLTRDGKVLGGTLAAATLISMINKARKDRNKRKACEYLETQYQKDKCFRELEGK